MLKDEPCPVFDTLDFFNRKWIFCILMDMFRGKKRFKEFKESNPKLSNYVLSKTLKYMEENNLIEKIIDNTKIEYKLTKRGLKTNKILYEMTLFSLDELECSKLNKNTKHKLLKEYKTSLYCGD